MKTILESANRVLGDVINESNVYSKKQLQGAVDVFKSIIVTLDPLDKYTPSEKSTLQDAIKIVENYIKSTSK